MKYLLTTLPTDDLGLLARALPVAHDMKARGHKIAICTPLSALNHDKIGRFALGRRKNQESIPHNTSAFTNALKKTPLVQQMIHSYPLIGKSGQQPHRERSIP